MKKKANQLLQSIFDVNHPFLRGAERVWDILLLNVLTVATSLPLVTVGLAKLALQASLWELEEKGKISCLSTYFSHLKAHLRQGMILSLVDLGLTLVCLLDLYLVWGQTGILADFFRVLCLAVLFFSQLLWVYLYPLAARFRLGGKSLFIQAILWMGKEIGLTARVALVAGLSLLLLFQSDWSLLIGLVLLVFIGYAAASLIFIKAFKKVLSSE